MANTDDYDPLAFIPDSLLNHPELVRRGIVICDTLKPGSVFCTKRAWGQPNPSYAVKLVKDDALAEPDVYDYLLDDLGNPRNHTLPCEVVHSNPSLIIMPFANNMVDALGPWGRVYDYMYQILEGMEYLHHRGVAHMDFYQENVLTATPYTASLNKQLCLWRAYIVDFGFSRRLELGPGHQPAIELPNTLWKRPREGATHFDPYAWDMLCVGRAFKAILRHASSPRRGKPHWLAHRYVEWVTGKEMEGCMGTVGVCLCRPTATSARRVFGTLRWILYFQDACDRALLWLWSCLQLPWKV